MKLKKILAGLLAVVMVVSLLPAMLFAVSAEDPIKLPVSGYVYSPLNVKNKGTESAKNMYVGAQFPVSAEITSVHVKANGPDLKQYAEWNPVTTIQFSEDGKVWKTAYTFPSEDADIDATITSSQFSSDVTGMTINYARVSRAIDQDPDSDIVQGSGHTAYWHT